MRVGLGSCPVVLTHQASVYMYLARTCISQLRPELARGREGRNGKGCLLGGWGEEVCSDSGSNACLALEMLLSPLMPVVLGSELESLARNSTSA